MSRRGWSRTSIFVLPKHADFPSLPHAEVRAPSGNRTRSSAMARQQAAVTSWALVEHNQIVREREHRAGLEPASPHYGCGVLAARRPVLVVSRTRGARTLTLLVKS